MVEGWGNHFPSHASLFLISPTSYLFLPFLLLGLSNADTGSRSAVSVSDGAFMVLWATRYWLQDGVHSRLKST